ncbi:MAG: hypothetical protein OXC66_06560, partial [Roseovarius sp.]|nr:hypothetical protein [Roseovarius sp.]
WVLQTTKYAKGDPAMPVASTISDIWCRFQEKLSPALTEIPGPLSNRHQKLVAMLEFATPEALLPAERRRAARASYGPGLSMAALGLQPVVVKNGEETGVAS